MEWYQSHQSNHIDRFSVTSALKKKAIYGMNRRHNLIVSVYQTCVDILSRTISRSWQHISFTIVWPAAVRSLLNTPGMDGFYHDQLEYRTNSRIGHYRICCVGAGRFAVGGRGGCWLFTFTVGAKAMPDKIILYQLPASSFKKSVLYCVRKTLVSLL